MRLPGLGPKTARRIWQELGITTVDELRAAAEAQQLRGLAGLGAKSEEKILAALGQAARGRGAAARAARDGAAEAARGRGGARARTRRPCEVSIAGSARRYRETVRDLDLIATATDAQALIDAFCDAAVGRRGRGARADEGDRRRRRTASASTCASSRPSRTATSSSTSPARRTTTSRCARPRCGAASRSPSTGSPRSRAARCTRSRPRRRSTRFLGYEWIPPELRENGGELEAARSGRAAGARRARRPARRPAHAHDLVGRQGHARGDGRRGRRDAATPTTRSATTRTGFATAGSTQQAEAIDALNERRAAPAPQGDRGEHPRGRRARRRRRGPRDARLGRRVGPHRASTTTRPSRVLAAMENPYVDCIGHLTGRKIGKRDAVADRRRARDREGARDRDVPRDQLAARPARPHRRPRARRARGGAQARDRLRRPPDRGARLRRARRRPGPPRVADEGGRRQHAHLEAGREAAEAAAP